MFSWKKFFLHKNSKKRLSGWVDIFFKVFYSKLLFLKIWTEASSWLPGGIKLIPVGLYPDYPPPKFSIDIPKKKFESKNPVFDLYTAY